MEFLESWNEGDDDDGDDDVITLRGPSARALLGILEGKDPAASDEPAGGGEPDPDPEPGPQRSQSRYFGGDK